MSRLTFMLLLAAACQGGATSSVSFQPAQSSSSLIELRNQIYVYATELKSDAIGYPHAPRSVYLTIDMSGKLEGGIPLEETSLDRLSEGHATLRVFEHAQQPRIYVVSQGTVRATLQQQAGSWGSYHVSIDAVLVDPVDGDARIHLVTEFDAPVSAIS